MIFLEGTLLNYICKCVNRHTIHYKTLFDIKLFELVVAFFSVVLFSVKHVYFLDLVYIGGVAFWTLRYKHIQIIDQKLFRIIIMYLIWVIIDFLCVSLLRHYYVEGRNIYQVVFELQILIWALDIKRFDVIRYIDYLVDIAVLYSIIILMAFFISGTYLHVDQLYGAYREWGEGLFPSNTTSASISFIFALFWSLYCGKGYIRSVLITLGGLLFPARVSMLALLLIWFFHFLLLFSYEVKIIIISFGGLLVGVMMPRIMSLLSRSFEDVYVRLTVSWDRIDIFFTSMSYISKHFLTGYGGRTLDQVYLLEYSDYSPLRNWPHTHNAILEVLLRYGVIGVLVFIVLLVYVFKEIRDIRIRLLLLLFIAMSMFQAYFKDFHFIFFVFVMIVVSKRLQLNRADDKK